MVKLCPLGYHCNVTHTMKRLGMKKETTLFEWFQISSFQYITDVIESIHKDVDSDILQFYSGGMRILHDQLYSYHYQNLDDFKIIFKRRAERFLNMLQTEDILFVRMNPKNRQVTKEELIRFHNCIQTINPLLKWKILMIDTDTLSEYNLPYVVSKSIPWDYFESDEWLQSYELTRFQSLNELFQEHITEAVNLMQNNELSEL